jgi:antitoxin component YwqK of YwqJK toxin-antitoxin module
MKIFLLVIGIGFVGCNARKQSNKPLRQVNSIPNQYVQYQDGNITFHQDTIYFKNTRFSGYTYSLYPNNDTASLEGYWQGLQEGISKKWYPNRQLAEARFFISGKKEGIHKAWWTDGKPKFMFDVSNDVYTNKFLEWNKNGVLVKSFHYKDGQEAGSQRLWWDDGSVRANYVIKNGKKYGLIGLKLCSNPYDSLNKK